MNKKHMTIVEEIIELDQDLLKLLARRAKLLQKTRRPKKDGMGTDSISSEKNIRLAWEEHAARFSKDPRLARQMFTLLQDISFMSRDDIEDKSSFNLAPSFKPADADIPAPASLTDVRLWMTLAAASGAACTLPNVQTAAPVQELLKSLNQAGASLQFENGAIVCTPDSQPAFADKVIFAGNDTLNVYLLALLAAGQTGTLKFTSGSGLKDADLSIFRNFIPSLGARMAHVVPRSNGLPVRIESSGIIPETIAVPADLPAEALTALLVVAPTWDTPITIDLSAHPEGASCLESVRTVLAACNVQLEAEATSVHFSACKATIQAHMPAEPAVAIDPYIGSNLLAFAAFAGGKVSLQGHWPEGVAPHDEALRLLRSCGLHIAVQPTSITASFTQEVTAAKGIDAKGTEATLYPLVAAFSCLRAQRSNKEILLPVPPKGIDMQLIESFAAQAGLAVNEFTLTTDADIPSAEAWTSPNAYWSMAYALLSYIKRQIGLANPGSITELMPGFWMFYNGLPSPMMQRTKPRNDNSDTPKRRRIIAGE